MEICMLVSVLLAICVILYVRYQNNFRASLAEKAANAAMHLAPDTTIEICSQPVNIIGARSRTLVHWGHKPFVPGIGFPDSIRLCAVVDTTRQMEQLLTHLGEAFSKLTPLDADTNLSDSRWIVQHDSGYIRFVHTTAGIETAGREQISFRRHHLDFPE